MAEGDGTIYNEFKFTILNGTHNLATAGNTIKVMLVTAHTPNIDTHTNYASVSADEESGAGYTATGETLGSQTTTKDTTNDKGVFDGADVLWTGLDVGTPSHTIVYNSTQDSLIIYFEITTASNGGNYTVAWDSGVNKILAIA